MHRQARWIKYIECFAASGIPLEGLAKGAWAPIRTYVFLLLILLNKNRRGATLIQFFLMQKRNAFINSPYGPVRHYFCRKLNCAPGAFGGGDAF